MFHPFMCFSFKPFEAGDGDFPSIASLSEAKFSRSSCPLKPHPHVPASIPHIALFIGVLVVIVSVAEATPSSDEPHFVWMAALFSLPVLGR